MARSAGLPMHIRRLARQMALGLAVVAGALAAFVFFGFLVFAHQVSVMEPDPSASADAVVALTGGSERIDEAVRLLADGRARRLLISGVHPRTTATAIGRLAGAGKPLLDCCIDLDRRALDTAGNADETARWLEARGYSSLIVVTSAYHMPRSLAEFRRVLPDARLIPHPVVADSLRLDRWWQRPMTAKLLFAEYVKYIVARARGLVAVPHQGKMVAASAGH
ncbi:MAG: YdcF family protein [Hyphomicrobiales bacterium]